eukprot:scaffold254052_cov27-Tisochrysis_lutea.AAC.2
MSRISWHRHIPHAPIPTCRMLARGYAIAWFHVVHALSNSAGLQQLHRRVCYARKGTPIQVGTGCPCLQRTHRHHRRGGSRTLPYAGKERK